MTKWANHAIYEIVEEEKDCIAAIREARPQGCIRYHEYFFQQEMNKRTTHTDEMWNILFENWTGNDLTEQWVYASTLRPISDIHIENAVGIISSADALYEGRWKIHGYIIHPGALDADTVRHFGLMFISKPGVAL